MATQLAPLEKKSTSQNPSQSVPSDTQTPATVLPTNISTSSVAVDSREMSPLLRLPPEVRTMIWEFVLLEDFKFRPCVQTIFKRVTCRDKRNEPYLALLPEKKMALARSCRSAYNEARPIFYGRNTFEFATISTMYTYLSMISFHNRRCIKKIFFSWGGFRCTISEAKNAFELLKQCIFLERLECLMEQSALSTRGGEMSVWNAKGLSAFRKIRVADPAKFRLSIVRGLWFPQAMDPTQLKAFENALQKEMTEEGLSMEEQIAENKIPDQAIPGRRWSTRSRNRIIRG